MMKSFIHYDISGKIIQVQTTKENLADDIWVPEGQSVLIVESFLHSNMPWKTHYIRDGAMIPRQPMPVVINKRAIQASGGDEAVFIGIPMGATAQIDGPTPHPPLTVDDGELVVTSNKPGKIRVVLSGLTAFLDWSGEIDAS
jgi:hypothetical protein